MKDIILNLRCLGNTTSNINYIMNNIDIKNINDKTLCDEINRLSYINPKIKKVSMEKLKYSQEKTYEFIQQNNRLNINYIDILDTLYPQQLRNIKNPPPILFYKGNINLLSNPNKVAIVGTRKPRCEALEFSYESSSYFSSNGFCVVSGLAKGCDEISHRACVENKSQTIAVLPSGLDEIYPASNNDLAQKIIETNGCIISEYLVGENINKQNFLNRNKIQSAISKGILVCECSKSSGTMQTVNFSKMQNKIIGCSNIQSSGNIKIIKEGAMIVDKDNIEDFKEKLINTKTQIINKTHSTQMVFETLYK